VFGDRWLLLTGQERALIDRLYERCSRLDDPKNTTGIYVGIQTSADAIYHLERIGPGRYVCQPEGKPKPAPYEVAIEDALMKPLVSGAEAKRYVEPITDTYLLFPYHADDHGVHLIDEATMGRVYPNAWAYLSSYRDTLRLREARRDRDGEILEAPFNDEGWYRFGRNQNLDKQEIVKLIVAQTVPQMRVTLDQSARMYLNNVRVNGIVVSESSDPWFILGVLNASVADFVFRRIAKVKDGGFFEANKQFIAPLPIPPATRKQREDVAARAKKLQSAHSARRDILVKIGQRLSTVRTRSKPETWLFPLLKSKRDLLAAAPARLNDDKKREWADRRYELDLAATHDLITARLRPGAALSAAFSAGELSFSIDGVRVVERIYVADAEGEFVVAQWKILAATFSITDNTDGKKLANALRKLAVQDNPAVVQQVIALETELSAIEAKIVAGERDMNALVDHLYGLSEAEAGLLACG
jgi:TaqI-like C-terminal specificity domain